MIKKFYKWYQVFARFCCVGFCAILATRAFYNQPLWIDNSGRILIFGFFVAMTLLHLMEMVVHFESALG